MLKSETLSSGILSFYKSLNLAAALPDGVAYMNPFQHPEAFAITQEFYNRYYGDALTRRIILGINPGRFGGGVTGIPFTDPINLETHCGIMNDFVKKPELSSTFIYQMIDAYGGPAKFYSKFFVSALSPLGFIKAGKNLNYYDVPQLQRAVEPFIITCIEKQLSLNIDRRKGFCLGEGTNFRYLKKLNDRFGFFEEIIPLPHPRFIMQYKRKHLTTYIQQYLDVLTS